MDTQPDVFETVHPEIARGLKAVSLPEVQELIRKISEYGLAVALPHAHSESGSFVPLPQGQVVFESDLKVSFLKEGNPLLQTAIPVMWRWDGALNAVGNCALCDFYKHPK